MRKVNEQLITYPTAILAKSKGFNVPVLYGTYGKQRKLTRYRDNDLVNWNAETKQQKHSQATSIPTRGVLQQWLKDTHDIDVWAQPFIFDQCIPDDTYSYFVYKSGGWETDGSDFESYEEAFEKGLQKALELL